jgi:precorrin-6B methylase 2
MLLEVPVVADDVLVDLGAGLGKVALLAHVFTGAKARGVELQPELVGRARQAASRLAPQVAFARGDAREVALDDGSVFFLYLPFTGPVLAGVLQRLRSVASQRAIVVCSLGLDLEATWLARRPVDSFWLTIYDSVVAGVPPRPARARSPLLGAHAETIAFER